MKSKTYKLAVKAFGKCVAEVTAKGLIEAVVDGSENPKESLWILNNNSESARLFWEEYSDGGFGYASRMSGETFTDREDRRQAKKKAEQQQGYKTYVLSTSCHCGAVLVEENDNPEGKTPKELRDWWDGEGADGFVFVTNGDISVEASEALKKFEDEKVSR